MTQGYVTECIDLTQSGVLRITMAGNSIMRMEFMCPEAMGNKGPIPAKSFTVDGIEAARSIHQALSHFLEKSEKLEEVTN